MPATNVNILGLVPELRAIIYDFYFMSNSSSDVAHVIHPGPEHNLLTASRLIYNEASPRYSIARRQHQSRQAQIWQEATHKLETWARNHRHALNVGLILADHSHCAWLTAANVAGLINRGMAVACSNPQSHNHGSTPWGCGCDASAPLNLACRKCSYYMRTAVFFTATAQLPLLSDDFHGGLLPIGEDVKPLLQALPFDCRAEFHCPRNYGVDFWRMEVDRQEFIDLRCNIRFDAVMEFYNSCEALGEPFEEWSIRLIEKAMLWPELKAFEDFKQKYADGELEWHWKYEIRAKRIQEKWESEGSRVYELVPTDAKSLEAVPVA